MFVGNKSCVARLHIQIEGYPKSEYTVNCELVVENYTMLHGSFDLFLGVDIIYQMPTLQKIKFGNPSTNIYIYCHLII
jgi:hypothetical protein